MYEVEHCEAAENQEDLLLQYVRDHPRVGLDEADYQAVLSAEVGEKESCKKHEQIGRQGKVQEVEPVFVLFFLLRLETLLEVGDKGIAEQRENPKEISYF